MWCVSKQLHTVCYLTYIKVYLALFQKLQCLLLYLLLHEIVQVVTVWQSVSRLEFGTVYRPVFPKIFLAKIISASLPKFFCSVLVLSSVGLLFAYVPTFLVSVLSFFFIESNFSTCVPPFILLLLPLVPILLGVDNVIISRLTLLGFNTLQIDVKRVI